MPPKLIILSEQLRGQIYELTEDAYSIGRSEEMSVCVPDPTISGHHCDLLRDGENEYRVVDGGSTNGTRINGVRITDQKLVNSDILQIGGVEIMYDTDDQSLTSVLSTQTGIDLEETAGGIQLEGMDNLSDFKRRKRDGGENPIARFIFFGIVGFLVIAVIILAVVLFFKLM